MATASTGRDSDSDSGSGSGSVLDSQPPSEWTKRDLRHTSAVVMVPPPRAWRAVQAIRAVHDKSYLRWMPHVNLLYPFLVDDERGRNFGAASEAATAALSGIAPFTCSLASFKYFKHKRSCTVWLHPSGPEPSGECRPNRDDDPSGGAMAACAPGSPTGPPASPGVMAVQAALQAAFPVADDLSTISAAGFTPHLSVGQWSDEAAAVAAAAALQADWGDDAMTFEVDAVYLISRSGDGPFEFKARIPLGGGGGGGGDETGEGEWWKEAYAPPPPPEGARCLAPKPARHRGGRGRKRGARRGEGGGGRGGEAAGAVAEAKGDRWTDAQQHA